MATLTLSVTEEAPNLGQCELANLQLKTKEPALANFAIDPNAQGVPHALDQDSVVSITSLMNKKRFAAIFVAFFTQGVNDSVTGALLPYIQSTYNIRYAIASLVFVGNAIGFISAVPFIQLIDHRFGRLKTLLFAISCNVAAYSVIIAQPPFGVIVTCFVVLGYGFSTILALDNAVVANSGNATILLGIAQGGYGLGGTVAPLLGTVMTTHGVRWSFFYLISLGLSLTNAALFTWSFHGFQIEATTSTLNSTRVTSEEPPPRLMQVLQNRSALLGSLFVFAYQGAEVTISGWIPSFLIDYRHGNPARVGYVTSGFWGGITVGRFVLCPLIERLGDRRSMFGLVVIWACFHLVIWLARDIVGNAVAVAIIGVLSGPVAPVATSVLSKLLDPNIQISGIGMAWSIGSGGGAVAPFLTGLLAQRFGAVVLNPICILLCAVMEIAWIGLPGRTWKKE